MRLFRLLVALTVLLLHHGAHGQRAGRPDDPNNVPPPEPGELFVGEWEWSSGGETFHVTLVRNPAHAFPDGEIINAVIGQYSLTRNEVLIDQSSATGPRPYALFCVPANNQSMRMSFKDNAKNKYAKAILTLVAGQPDMLIWKIEPVERMYFDGDVIPPPGFTVPTSVTLTRQ